MCVACVCVFVLGLCAIHSICLLLFGAWDSSVLFSSAEELREGINWRRKTVKWEEKQNKQTWLALKEDVQQSILSLTCRRGSICLGIDYLKPRAHFSNVTSMADSQHGKLTKHCRVWGNLIEENAIFCVCVMNDSAHTHRRGLVLSIKKSGGIIKTASQWSPVCEDETAGWEGDRRGACVSNL